MEVLFMKPDQYQKHMDKIKELNLRLQPSAKLMKDFIIDNDDFVSIMKIAARTAQRWCNEGKISYYQVGAKIYYTRDDIEIFLKKHYNESFANRRKTRNQTLWGAWAILGKSNKVFFSGDSGYFDEFKKVGKNYGLVD